MEKIFFIEIQCLHVGLQDSCHVNDTFVIFFQVKAYNLPSCYLRTKSFGAINRKVERFRWSKNVYSTFVKINVNICMNLYGLSGKVTSRGKIEISTFFNLSNSTGRRREEFLWIKNSLLLLNRAQGRLRFGVDGDWATILGVKTIFLILSN